MRPSLKSFTAWLKTKPKKGAYCYLDHGECLVAKYLRSLGYMLIRFSPIGARS